VGQAIGQVIPLAVVVAISPIPIIAIVPILATPRARANGPAIGAKLIGDAISGFAT
jgi:hypothetical protein